MVKILNMQKPTLLVLAAGMGSRYGGLKQLDQMGPSGETIMDYSVYDAVEAGFGKVVFVIRKFFREEFEAKVSNKYKGIVDVVLVEQELENLPEGFTLNPSREKPWGTGHAVLMAKDVIDTPFAVINADDYYGKNSFKILADHLISLERDRGEFSMIGFRAVNTLSETGVVSRGVCTTDSANLLLGVEEHHQIKRDAEGAIKGVNSAGDEVKISEESYVSMNMWGFTPDIFEYGYKLFIEFMSQRGDELKSEFYIPFVVNSMLNSGIARCRVLGTPDVWFGVTYKEEREGVAKRVAKLVNDGLYPSPLFK